MAELCRLVKIFTLPREISRLLCLRMKMSVQQAIRMDLDPVQAFRWGVGWR